MLQSVAPIKLRKNYAVELAARLTVRPTEYQKSTEVVNGIPSSLEISTSDALPHLVEIETTADANLIRMVDFPAGSVLVLKTWLSDECSAALQAIRKLCSDKAILKEHIGGFSNIELNIALYRADAEERDLFGEKNPALAPSLLILSNRWTRDV